ncbi:hypothetical protein M885DRAFT_524828 [Pelagophyceae sp. CCMP2097]|nr:hypothetical protein M885DRAFT_524828 [Pelagophyceae sp. CCMP2097]
MRGLVVFLAIAGAAALSRRQALRVASAAGGGALLGPRCGGAASYQSGVRFEGGAGGLGKSKPETGVIKADRVVERAASEKGRVAELLAASSGAPVQVEYDAPWTVTADGLGSRDYSTGDGAFLVVAQRPLDGGDILKAVKAAVFSSTGKYGAYGAPQDVKLKSRSLINGEGELFEFTFVAFTPAMREVERHILVKAVVVDSDVFMLVVGALSSRWSKAEPLIRNVAQSFTARLSPEDAGEMRIFRNKQRRRGDS